VSGTFIFSIYLKLGCLPLAVSWKFVDTVGEAMLEMALRLTDVNAWVLGDGFSGRFFFDFVV
jgi:hypothetical protein